MNKKLKLILGIVVFVILIGGAVILYNTLSKKISAGSGNGTGK